MDDDLVTDTADVLYYALNSEKGKTHLLMGCSSVV